MDLRAYDTILTYIYDFAKTNIFAISMKYLKIALNFTAKYFIYKMAADRAANHRFQLTKCKQILPNLPNWEWIISFISGWLLSCVFFCVTGQWECLLTNCNRRIESEAELILAQTLAAQTTN